MHNNRIKLSIKSKVSLIICVLIIIAVSVNFIVLVSIAESTMKTSTKSTVNDLVEANGLIIEGVVKNINESMSYLINSDKIIEYVDSKGIINEYNVKSDISDYIKKNSGVENLSIVSKNGIILLSSDKSLVGNNLSDKSYVSDTLSNAQAHQSNLLVSSQTNNPIIQFANPIISQDGNVNGVIVATVNIEKITENLKNVSVLDTKSSYCYMLDSTGITMYHPIADKIGKPVENVAMKNIIEQLENGENISRDVITYDYDGALKYAGYRVSPINNWILIVSADQKDILQPISQMTSSSLKISTVLIIILVFIGYIFAGTISKPIKKITSIINETAELDLIVDNTYKNLMRKSDETGEMSNAIFKMRETISEIINKISDASKNINNNAISLNVIANKVSENTNDNSATAQELSASMEQTAASTEKINDDIKNMDEKTNEITHKTFDGTKLCEALTKRAEILKNNTINSSMETKKIYEDVKNSTEAAIEQSKAVEKISLLTKTIIEIADQTSLLSLNASVEAARAGDLGKGFAVVADEIGKLALKSTHTVKEIKQMVSEINEAVKNVSYNAEKTLEFLDKKVLKDYENFVDVSEQYNKDALSINDTMVVIYEATDILSEKLLSITESMSNVNLTISDSAVGASNMADKNMAIVLLTTDVYNMVKQSTEYAEILDDIVSKFKF